MRHLLKHGCLFLEQFSLQYGFQSVMEVPECLKAIILCLKVDNLKTQALVVKVICSIPYETSRSVLAKTDDLQTNFSSAASAISLCR